MDLEKIEGLVKIIENSSLTEFSIKDGETKITMSKLTHPPVIAAGVPAEIQNDQRVIDAYLGVDEDG